MDGERVVVEGGRVGVEGVVGRLEVDHGLVVAREDAVQGPVGLDRERELVHARRDGERLRVAVGAREREGAVGGREDHGPHLVLELLVDACRSAGREGRQCRRRVYVRAGSPWGRRRGRWAWRSWGEGGPRERAGPA